MLGMHKALTGTVIFFASSCVGILTVDQVLGSG
jgi:hypothetical protein